MFTTKKKGLLVVLIAVVIALLAVTGVNATDKKVIELPVEAITVADSYDIDKVTPQMLSEKQQTLARELGIDVDKITKAEVVNDMILDVTYTQYMVDTANYIAIDQNNKIVEVSTYDPETMSSGDEYKWKTTEKDYLAKGEEVLGLLGLDGQYELIESSEFSPDYWVLYYREKLDNGLINPYKGVGINIVRADNSVGLVYISDKDVNTQKAEITEEEALENAQPTITKLGDNAQVANIELMYTRPNYAWDGSGVYKLANYVRLVYNINIIDETAALGGEYEIHVDAVTGEVVGGNVSEDLGGAFGQATGGVSHTSHNYTQRVQRAFNKLRTMGYNPTTKMADNTYNLKTAIINHLTHNSAYAFHFSGHGSANNIGAMPDALPYPDSKTPIWTLQRTSIAGYNGNWKFVYLDCCSGGTANWTHAFNITNNSTNRAFIGYGGKITSDIANAMNNEIYYNMGRRSIHQAVVRAQTVVGTNLGWFCGDRDYWG
ncbi:MAG: hypothetical protein ACOX05_01920 [Bacillota bacterium]|jgi:hypothetical protein